MTNRILKENDLEIYTSENQSKIMFIFPEEGESEDDKLWSICVPATGKEELDDLLQAIDGKEDFFAFKNKILVFDRENKQIQLSINHGDMLTTTYFKLSENMYVQVIENINDILN